jgi:DNA topoisomerase IB
VNEYHRERTGEDLTANDLRTWHATVLAAAALAQSEEPGDTKASRKRAVKKAIEEVSEFLGNTPAIARASYVDPRVVDLYEDGVTIGGAIGRNLEDPDARQAALERAVRRLLASA